MPIFTNIEALANPYPHFKKLRQESPVYFDQDLQMYVLSKHCDVTTALTDTNSFSSGQALFSSYNHEDIVNKILIEKAHGPFAEVLPMTDPPRHTRVRALVNGAFSAKRVSKIQSYIDTVTEELFDNIEGKSQAEIVSELAVPLPVAIIAHMLCVPRERSEDIKRWTEYYSACACNRLSSEEEATLAGEHLAEMQNYIVAHLEERRANPGDDVLTDLINARTGDGQEPLTNKEILATSAAFLGAGHETSTVAITHAFRYLAMYPEELKRIQNADDMDAAIRIFCEELLRLEPPTRSLLRVSLADTVMSGVSIPAGSLIMILTGSANRDEDVFGENADVFDSTRSSTRKHVSFGAGVHMCIGNMLARAELKQVVKAIALRFDKIDLANKNPGIEDFHPVVMPINFQPNKLQVNFEKIKSAVA